ncbi:10867_t:CDS:2 [Funneliformis mosseae]|uniref:10867_t:CDS:1 n=1 Tax=Funneliformis mosseae TaxID=27381 RepID=A0A9N9AR71_FUNMO|nr:10867_t:CDS:2 [Funneliformis mosseae]
MCQAGYQRKSKAKKRKLLQEHQKVIKYDSPDYPPLLIQYSDLHKHIHETVKTHHHLAIIANVSVLLDERNKHIDKYYYLAFRKGAKQFATLFSTYSVIVFQDDKAKIPLGIPAVRRTFQTI